ncbi:MAG TPA: asparaginase [Myxococcota bacterium]|nr:asparaginase [Myxococcota bacterium]
MRLLFLHTGGTLGMKGEPGPLEPEDYEETVLPFVRGLEELGEIEHRFLCNIDSSDMDPTRWQDIARTVAENIDTYCGFVVLHGTDTMAYSAAACALLLENLPKPVVFTGAQRPIHQLRSDGRQNLIHATICATRDVPEVAVYFDGKLLRASRTTKYSVQSYSAYRSPGTPPLMTMGADILQPLVPRRPRGPFRLRSGFERHVAVLTLFPGIESRVLDAVVDGGARGVILRSFGAGNVPLMGWPEAVARARAAGAVVIVATQCVEGRVELGRYAGSAAVLDAGALSAADMTLEGALTKTMFLLAQDEAFEESWPHDLAGEVSPH